MSSLTELIHTISNYEDDSSHKKTNRPRKDSFNESTTKTSEKNFNNIVGLESQIKDYTPPSSTDCNENFLGSHYIPGLILSNNSKLSNNSDGSMNNSPFSDHKIVTNEGFTSYLTSTTSFYYSLPHPKVNPYHKDTKVEGKEDNGYEVPFSETSKEVKREIYKESAKEISKESYQ